ncbi:MAG: hypothetical protein ACLP50_02935 [Solirubrobacteraceae bacterium]
MDINRAQFLLLSRGGRVPPAVRSGPPSGLPDGRGLQFAERGPGGVGAPQWLRARVRARRSRNLPPLPVRGELGPEAYAALEFAVSDERASRRRVQP